MDDADGKTVDAFTYIDHHLLGVAPWFISLGKEKEYDAEPPRTYGSELPWCQPPYFVLFFYD